MQRFKPVLYDALKVGTFCALKLTHRNRKSLLVFLLLPAADCVYYFLRESASYILPEALGIFKTYKNNCTGSFHGILVYLAVEFLNHLSLQHQPCRRMCRCPMSLKNVTFSIDYLK